VVDQEPIKSDQAAAIRDVETHPKKPLDVLGAAAVDVLRVDARHTHIARPSTAAHCRTRARRILSTVTLLVAIQFIAAAAGADLTTVLELYGSLAAVGLVPALRKPYFLIKRSPLDT
jgi:hypothetical protein